MALLKNRSNEENHPTKYEGKIKIRVLEFV